MLRYVLYRSSYSKSVVCNSEVECTFVHLLLTTKHVPLGNVFIREGSIVAGILVIGGGSYTESTVVTLGFTGDLMLTNWRWRLSLLLT
jgi:hypothetical protein